MGGASSSNAGGAHGSKAEAAGARETLFNFAKSTIEATPDEPFTILLLGTCTRINAATVLHRCCARALRLGHAQGYLACTLFSARLFYRELGA